MQTENQATVAPKTPSRSGRERWFVILYRRGPGWVAGKSIGEQPLHAHRAYMAQLCKQGVVEHAGPFLDEESGGMVLLRAPDLSAAQAIAEADPAVSDGVLTGAARPFYPMFGAAAAA